MVATDELPEPFDRVVEPDEDESLPRVSAVPALLEPVADVPDVLLSEVPLAVVVAAERVLTPTTPAIATEAAAAEPMRVRRIRPSRRRDRSRSAGVGRGAWLLMVSTSVSGG